MAAPEGNQFWKLADPMKFGRPRIFDTPVELWNECILYFQECDDNPLVKTETTTSEKGTFSKEIMFKVPYTWDGLYVFIGVSNLDYYKENKDFSGIITHVGNIIRNQKYTGAATGLFNANIIARDLGLGEKLDVTTKGDKIENDKISLSLNGSEIELK